MAYEASSIRRNRRTKAQLADLDDAIYAAAETEHPVSLRGVFYRVVSAGAIEKTDAGYETVGRQLVKLRREGRVPYRWIVDGTRTTYKLDSYTSIDQALDDAAASYRRSLWHDQPVALHLVSEKDAITGVVFPITQKYDVPLHIVRGYSSETFAHSLAEEIREEGKQAFIYQLGDHDPSGINAWENLIQKILDFLADDFVSHEIPFPRYDRIAVTEEQILSMNLPTRPPKQKDTRSKKFKEYEVNRAVEVDAIPASVLRDIVENVITQHIDQKQLRINEMVEARERELLSRLKGLISTEESND